MLAVHQVVSCRQLKKTKMCRQQLQQEKAE